jgi:hypothetical protein
MRRGGEGSREGRREGGGSGGVCVSMRVCKRGGERVCVRTEGLWLWSE